MANEFVARNGIIALDNSVISGSLIVTNGITGSFTGTASYAANALSSSNSLTSSFAFQAANAASASNALSASFAFQAANASSASFATTASFAFNTATAASASFTTTASFAFNASTAASASFATNAANATTASHAVNAVTSSFATQAANAANATTASHALNAVTASRALQANTASYIQNAASASYALSSSYALNASTATSASFATNSSTAASASFATNASTAASASFATSAANATTASHAVNAVTASHALNAVTASHALNAVTASYIRLAASASNALSASYALNASNATSASYSNFAISSSFASNAANASSASFAAFASTASNAQTLAPGTTVSASNVYVSNNLFVAGTASFGFLQTVTGSAVIIGEQYIVLNADTPISQFAGIQIYDTGSSSTASFEWNGVGDYWIGVEETGQSYGFLTGVTSSKGNEIFPVLNKLVKGTGYHGLQDSSISDNGSIVSVNSNTQITGSLLVSAGITANLTGTSSFATSASFAGNAANAASASFATSAANATTASHAVNAVTASFALNSQNAFVQNGNSFGTQALLGTNDTQNLAFETNGSIRMFISSSGNVGINSATPNASLEVYAGSSTTSVLWGQYIRNIGNAATTGYGVGLKLKLSGETIPNEYYKWAGVAAVAGTDYSNRTDLAIYTNATSNSDPSEKVRITGDGSVGIGTTIPAQRLDVRGFIVSDANNNGSQAGFYLGNSNHGLSRGNSSNTVNLYTTSGDIRLSTNTTSTVHLIVASGGNVGIGTTAPTQKLHAEGRTLIQGSAGYLFDVQTTDANKPRFQVYVDDTNGIDLISGYDTTAKNLRLVTGGSVRMFISGSGNVGIGSALPAYLLDVNGSSRIVGDTYFGSIINFYQGDARIWVPNVGEALTVKQNTGNVGIGTTSPQSKLDIVQAGNTAGGTLMLSGNKTNNAIKYGYITTLQYASSDEPEGVVLIGGTNTSTFNRISIGGDIGEANAATEILFWTAANTTTRGGSTRMIIDSNGNVGIGTTTNLTGKLNFPASDYGESINFYTSATATNRTGIGKYLQELRFYVPSGDSFTWYGGGPAGSEVMRVSGSGNVGIGTTSPSQKLEIHGDILIENGSDNVSKLLISNGGGGNAEIIGSEADGILRIKNGNIFAPVIHFLNSADSVMMAINSGNVGIGTTAPQYKLEVSGDKSRFYNVSIGGTVGGDYAAYSDSVVGTVGNLHLAATGAGAVYINTAIARPMYINPVGGSVGVGTTAATQKFHIRQTDITDNTAATLLLLDGKFQDASVEENDMVSIGFRIENSSGGSQTNQAISFAYNNILSLMKDGGNVGIGSTSPQTKLDVIGDTFIKGVIFAYAGSAGNQVGGITWSSTDDGTLFLKASNVTKVNINSNGSSYFNGGNVGIGTTSPNSGATLAVNGNIVVQNANSSVFFGTATVGYGDSAAIGRASTNGFHIQNSIAGDLCIGAEYSKAILFGTGTSGTLVQRMIVTSGGNVGIGSTSPDVKLRVEGNAILNGAVSANTTYNAFALNVGGIAYIIGGSVWVNDAYGYTNASSVNTGMYPDSTHNITFKNNNSSNVYIKSDGNVGIGTTSPAQKLHIYTATNYQGVLINGSNAPAAGFAKGTTTTPEWKVGISGNDGSSFSVSTGAANTDLLFVSSSGNVGVGTTTPSYRLDVNGNVRFSGVLKADPGITSGYGSIFTGHNSSFQITINADYSGGQSNTYTPQYAGAPSAGMFVMKQRNGGEGTVDMYVKASGTDGSTTNISTFTNIMIWHTNGNVGIGSTTPSTKLDVNGNTTIRGSLAFRTTGTNNGNLIISDNGGGTATINNSGNSFLDISSASSTTITAGNFIVNNNIGIGTTAPTAKLDVRGGSDGDAMISMGSNSVSGILNSPANMYINADSDNNSSDGIIALGFNRTGYTGGTEVMRILESGNVGIGTTSPTGAFTVGGESGSIASHILSWGQSERYERKRGATFASGLIYKSFNKSSDTLFPSPPTEATFTSGIKNYSGTVKGIGVTANINSFTLTGDYYYVEFFGLLYVTSSQVYYFDTNSDDASDVFIDGKRVADYYGPHGASGLGIKGSIYLSQGYHKFYTRYEEGGGGDTQTVSWSTDGGSTYVVIPSSVFYHDPNDIIRSDGSANAYFLADVVAYSTSDARLKDNVTPLSTPIDRLMKLQGVDFTWKPDIDSEYAGKKDIGLIAQQVEEVLPDAVETRYNGYKAVRYEKVIPLLVEAIKEQQKQIDELKYLLQTQNK